MITGSIISLQRHHVHLHNQPKRMTPYTTPIFIVGTQRSGTTLLRLILNSHSTIAIPEEARFLTPLLSRHNPRRVIHGPALSRLVEYLRANEQFRLWNYDQEPFLRDLINRDSISLADFVDGMFSSYAVSEGKSTWGDKSLFFGSIDLLHELFPRARFIHIIRDGRDVFDSWRKMDPTKRHPTVMALDWRYKLRNIERSIDKLPASLAITLRYEDLIVSPEKVIQSLCKFLCIPFEPGMLEFHKTSSRYIGEHHSKLIFSSIDASNATKWLKNLSTDEITLYELIAGSSLRRYSYVTSDNSVCLRQYLLAASDMIIGFPKRMWQVASARLAYRRALKHGESTKTITVGEMPDNNIRDNNSSSPM